MAAMCWADRLARLPMPHDEVVEVISRAIYLANWRAPAPTWDTTSDEVREWVRRQGRAGLAALNGLTRPSK
jgi:hypothetical protein